MTQKVVLSSLRADLDREKAGDWISYPAWKGVRFNVSALTITPYETARDLMFKRLAEKYKDEQVPKEEISRELGALYAEYILHGWEGFDEEYTPELARERLIDPSYRTLVSAVEWCAAKVSEVNVRFTEAELGN
ncbi:hypothetical protein LJR221_001432 [Agrobacterium tumefaciens]